MIFQCICRKQSLLLMIFIGSMISLYLVITTKPTHITSSHTHDHDVKSAALNDNIEIKMKTAKVIDGPKKLQRTSGNLHSVGCKVKTINPFSEEIMKYMHNFGDHVCPVIRDLHINVNLNQVEITAVNIDYIRTREIIADDKKGFQYMDFTYVSSPKRSTTTLTKGLSGAIKNKAASRCIVPIKYNEAKVPEEIDVIFSSKCKGDEAVFTYTHDGLFQHNVTRKCLGPKGGLTNPPQNTPMVISNKCNVKFNVILTGLLQLSGSNSCIHPLWGGHVPEEGQKLCAYPACVVEKRLSYRLYQHNKDSKSVQSKRSFSLDKDMNHVELQFMDERTINAYVLSMKPKPLPSVDSTAPNIIVISIEEASGPHFKRKLPQTYAAMTKMGFSEYELHASVSTSAAVNFMAMVNGRSVNGGNTDGSIFQLAKKSKYVSMYSADDPFLNMNNFDADHSSVSLFRALKQNYDLAAQSYCVTGQPIYELSNNYLLTFIKSYPKHPKLAVILLSEITGANYNYIGYMDKGFLRLLGQLGELKNTIIFIQTLIGGVTGKLGQLPQGLDESKRPFLSRYVSQDIQTNYKFESNRHKQLSTSYDVYATLRNILLKDTSTHEHGKSLVETMQPRNCLQASVDPTLCPCI